MNTRAPSNPPVGREQRKQRTRADLMQAALELLEQKSFSSLSLREVTRALVGTTEESKTAAVGDTRSERGNPSQHFNEEAG